jgi:NAD(P)-dependent dehydrogenase (short-subunit alcohol dehydrogenase family)
MPVALVTGAASGIGQATTLRLLNEDYNVLAVDLEAGEPEDGMIGFAADLTTREGNELAVHAAID